MQLQAASSRQAGLASGQHAGSASSPIACRCSPAFLGRWQQQRSHAHRNVVLAATATDKLPELKQKLKKLIDTVGTSTAFPPEALPVLEEIDAVVQENGVPEITAEGIRGRFRQALNNTNFLDPDGNLSLGVLTFNQFGPKNLKLRLLGVQLLQGVESPDQYSTEATFEILDGELAGVQGVQKTLGRYEVTGKKRGRQDVYFSGVALFPKQAEDRERWVAVLKDHNPTMNDEGRAEIQFPGSAAHGFRDFRILDDDLTLTVGNRKSYVCVQPVS